MAQSVIGAGPRFRVHGQGVAVVDADNAGVDGSGDEVGSRGDARDEGRDQSNGKVRAHGVMLPPRQEQTKTRW